MKLTQQARKDLVTLSQYTRKEWGENQLALYREQLKIAFNQLLELPRSVKNRDDVRKGYRCLPVGQHVIFYRLSREAIEIIAIPHSKSDPSRHITD